MTPEEAKSKIESEAIAAVENAMAKRFTYLESYCELYEQGAYFMFNLLSKEISEKDEEIGRLKELLKNIHQAGVESIFLVGGYGIERAKSESTESWEQFKTINQL